MSCSTLDQQSTRLSVSAGALPEGFCPESMQDLFNAMAARLIVTPSANFAGITMGSIEPSGNVGLWLKDCEELFVFDDATARYVPITKGGFTEMQYFTSSGSFIVPAFIYKIKVSAWGAGGGGFSDGSGAAGGGGGGGGYGQQFFNVIPGQTINFTVGLGGSTGSPATAGGTTTFLTLIANGGTAGIANVPSVGGTVAGGLFSVKGGSSGPVSSANGIAGFGGYSSNGGEGGSPTVGGDANNLPGIVPGGGGAGGFSVNPGGAGASGAVLVEW